MKKIGIGITVLAVTLLLSLSLTSCKKSRVANSNLATGYVGADFSVKVKVPDTSSKFLKTAQPMDKNITALEVSKLMGNGINLGNTMEKPTEAGISIKTRKLPFMNSSGVSL